MAWSLAMAVLAATVAFHCWAYWRLRRLVRTGGSFGLEGGDGAEPVMGQPVQVGVTVMAEERMPMGTTMSSSVAQRLADAGVTTGGASIREQYFVRSAEDERAELEARRSEGYDSGGELEDFFESVAMVVSVMQPRLMQNALLNSDWKGANQGSC